jgi:hypothetical protein
MWRYTTYNMIEIYGRHGGIYCLHLQEKMLKQGKQDILLYLFF